MSKTIIKGLGASTKKKISSSGKVVSAIHASVHLARVQTKSSWFMLVIPVSETRVFHL